jgi:hypothetical protein
MIDFQSLPRGTSTSEQPAIELILVSLSLWLHQPIYLLTSRVISGRPELLNLHALESGT